VLTTEKETYLYWEERMIHMTSAMDKNFDFYLTLNLEKYAGKWIAILDNQVVASGDNFKDVFDKVKKEHPNKRPLFDRVSEAAHHFLK